MQVKEIMKKDVIGLSPDMPVMDAAQKLSELEISGLPVLDPDNKLLGMFTEKDILRAIIPSYVEHVGKFIYEHNARTIKKKVEELSNLKVKDVMREEVVTIGEDANIQEIARVMLTQRARRVPVVEKDKKVIGIIARCDVVRALIGIV